MSDSPTLLALAYGGVVIDEAGRVLLREPKNHFDYYVYTFPKGRPDEGESPEQAALREVREETGVEARAWHRLTDITLSNSSTDERGCLFLATDLVHGEADPDPTEALGIRWVPFEEALAMTRDGRITDVMSIAAIGRVALERAMRG